MTIAEESTAWPGVTRPTHLGGLGFGFKWNMGWMHDTLGYMSKRADLPQYHHHQMTFSLVYAFTENYVLPITHDEVVHGKGSLLRKMPGDRWQQLANLRAYLAYMWAHPGKQLLFMGWEFGQDAEWAESRSLDWWLLDDPAHRGVADAGRATSTGSTRETPALWSQRRRPGRLPLDRRQRRRATTLFSFLRYGERRPGAGLRRQLLRRSRTRATGSACRAAGRWREVLNTDAEVYGGSRRRQPRRASRPCRSRGTGSRRRRR